MIPLTPDNCYLQRYQSRTKLFSRSKRKRIAATTLGRCNKQPMKQHQNKIHARSVLEQKILAWRPVEVLAAAIRSRAAPDLFINRREVDRPPWGK